MSKKEDSKPEKSDKEVNSKKDSNAKNTTDKDKKSNGTKSSEKEPQKEKPKKKNIFQKHPLVFLLLGALVISILWGMLKVNRVEKALTEKYEMQIKEERELMGEKLARTFSWVMRSELTRNNKEQAEQYMVEFLRGDLDISRVSYYDKSEGKIAFSTDKSFEKEKIKDEFILNTSKAQSKEVDDGFLITAPVMGLDKQLGIIIINWKIDDKSKDEDEEE